MSRVIIMRTSVFRGSILLCQKVDEVETIPPTTLQPRLFRFIALPRPLISTRRLVFRTFREHKLRRARCSAIGDIFVEGIVGLTLPYVISRLLQSRRKIIGKFAES